MTELAGEWNAEERTSALIELLAEARAALEQVPGVVTGAPLPAATNSSLRRAHAGLCRALEELPLCAAELRRLDQALHASEKHFHLVADFTSDWEFWRAPEGFFLYVSPSCERITGYRAQEFLSDPDLYRRIVHTDDLPLLDRHLREACPSDEAEVIEFRIVTHGGQTHWIEHVCRPVYDDDGTWLGRRGSNRDVTARKQAEQEQERLRAEVEGQRVLIEAVANYMPVGVAVLDAQELRALWANPAYLRFLDEPFRSRGVIGARLQDFIPGAEETGLAAIHREVAASGRPHVDPELEYAGFERGTTYWNWSLQRLLPAPGDERVLLLLLAYEVTEQVLARREAERAAAEARKRAAELDAVLAAIPHGVTIYGPQAQIIQSNRASQELTRQTESSQRAPLQERMQALRLTWPDGRPISPQDTPVVRALNGQAVRNVIVGTQEDDAAIWLSISGAPLRSPGGEIEGAVLSFIDVTDLHETQSELELLAAKLEIQAEQLLSQNVELLQARDELELRVRERTADLMASNDALHAEIAARRQAEADLRESERRFRQLAEHIDGVFVLLERATSQVLYVSPAYEMLWGRPVDELYQDARTALQSVVTEDATRLRAAWNTGRLYWDEEFRIIRPDGSLRWVRARAFPVSSEPGDGQRIAGIVEDITMQKEAQEALVQAERLHTAGLLVSALSHEMNNPLQAAIGCLGLAREAVQESQPIDSYLQVSHEALQRAIGVMVQMRGLYDAPAGERRQPIDVAALSKKVLLMSRPRCEAKDVRAVWERGQDLPQVMTAPNVLQQVFLNLVMNAIDAMPEGGELRVTAEHCPQQQKVWVRFYDTGGGIDPKRLKHVFEPFYSTKAEGLGLGLFISQTLMQRLGGGIEIESVLGKGTTISVWLPA